MRVFLLSLFIIYSVFAGAQTKTDKQAQYFEKSMKAGGLPEPVQKVKNVDRVDGMIRTRKGDEDWNTMGRFHAFMGLDSYGYKPNEDVYVSDIITNGTTIEVLSLIDGRASNLNFNGTTQSLYYDNSKNNNQSLQSKIRLGFGIDLTKNIMITFETNRIGNTGQDLYLGTSLTNVQDSLGIFSSSDRLYYKDTYHTKNTVDAVGLHLTKNRHSFFVKYLLQNNVMSFKDRVYDDYSSRISSLTLIRASYWDIGSSGGRPVDANETLKTSFNNIQIGYSYRMRGFVPYVSYTITQNGNDKLRNYDRFSAGFSIYLF